MSANLLFMSSEYWFIEWVGSLPTQELSPLHSWKQHDHKIQQPQSSGSRKGRELERCSPRRTDLDYSLTTLGFMSRQVVLGGELLCLLVGLLSKESGTSKAQQQILLDILFSSNHNIHKSLCSLWFLGFRPFN